MANSSSVDSLCLAIRRLREVKCSRFVLQLRELRAFGRTQQIVGSFSSEVQARSAFEVQCIGRSPVQGDSFTAVGGRRASAKSAKSAVPFFCCLQALHRCFPVHVRFMPANTAAIAPRMIVVAALILASCREAPREKRATNDAIVESTAVPPAESAQSGIRFDPETLRPGERVGDLVVDTLSFRRALVDSTFVGMARFSGEMQLTGRTMRHPDADLRHTEMCFEAYSSSATRLPRWPADERRPWFCFVNRDAAVRALRGPSEGIAATIVIDQFTINRGLSDEVNSARLVRVVQDSVEPASLDGARRSDPS